MRGALVLVTGAGRSGTSTAAGTLSHLGVHVPGPFLEANDSNPKGFYESRWSVEFHNKLLKRANVTLADSRPGAVDIVREAVSDQDRNRLLTWLEANTSGHRLTAIKDPRTTWTLGLWSEVGGVLGISTRFLTMLRHPAEVIGSRATHYPRGIEVLGERGFAVKNLAGWVNAMLLTEEQTRGSHRVFVRYDDLLADWRTAMAEASRVLDIVLDLGPTEDNPVDEFIDPRLSRHPLSWADVDVPLGLQEVAQIVWEACDRLAESRGSDVEAEALLDEMRERYAAMYLDAQQLTRDAASARVAEARAEAAREARQQARQEAAAQESTLRRKARAALGRVKRRIR
jgi:hypothetical protein